MSVSVDGFIADREGAFGWTVPSDELFRFHTAKVRQLGGYLLGRGLPETMLVWETDPSMRDSELDALIDAPDRASWTGRRDHAIIVLLAQTGSRASELTGLACGYIHLGRGAHATTTGKGRKQRITPLTKQTAAVLLVWPAERAASPADPLFPTSTARRSPARRSPAGSPSRRA